MKTRMLVPALLATIMAILTAQGVWVVPVSASGLPSLEERITAADLHWSRRSQAGVTEVLLQNLEGADRDYPDQGEVLWRLARAYWWKSTRFPKDDKKTRIEWLDKAKATGERAAKAAPGNPDAHYWYAAAMAETGVARGILQSLFMVKPTREALERGLEADPNHASCHYLMAELYLQLPGPPLSIGNKQKSVQEARLAVKYGPDSSSHWLVLGRALIATKQYDEARQALNALLAMAPDPGDPDGTRADQDEARAELQSIANK
jgi:tetratricopeptide (TPR) repeat protein